MILRRGKAYGHAARLKPVYIMGSHGQLIGKRKRVAEINDGIDVRQMTAFLDALRKSLYGAHDLVGIHAERGERRAVGRHGRKLPHVHVPELLRKHPDGIIQPPGHGLVPVPVVQSPGGHHAEAVAGKRFKDLFLNDKTFHLYSLSRKKCPSPGRGEMPLAPVRVGRTCGGAKRLRAV